MKATSRWAIGTYELLLTRDPEGSEGDIVLTIFAKPVSGDPADDEDAPILTQMDIFYAEVGYSRENPPPWDMTALRDIGEEGLTPEGVEAEYGPKMAARILLALFYAARADFEGLDQDGMPWRGPSTEAFPIMERTHDVMTILKTRLYDM